MRLKIHFDSDRHRGPDPVLGSEITSIFLQKCPDQANQGAIFRTSFYFHRAGRAISVVSPASICAMFSAKSDSWLPRIFDSIPSLPQSTKSRSPSPPSRSVPAAFGVASSGASGGRGTRALRLVLRLLADRLRRIFHAALRHRRAPSARARLSKLCCPSLPAWISCWSGSRLNGSARSIPARCSKSRGGGGMAPGMEAPLLVEFSSRF